MTRPRWQWIEWCDGFTAQGRIHPGKNRRDVCATRGSNPCCVNNRSIAAHQCESDPNNAFFTSHDDPFYGTCCGKKKGQLPPVPLGAAH